MTESYIGCSVEVERILASDLPDLEKLAQAFGCITGFVVGHAQAEIDLARALEDREQVRKIQIKRDSLAHARSIFETCYLRVTGRRPWSETA
jgi:hypothetical protein